MPETDLPIVESFTIPSLGWRFEDLRSIEDPRTQRRVSRAWVSEIRDVFESRGESLHDWICAFDAKGIDDEHKRFAEDRQREPRLTRKNWLKRDNRRRPTDPDGSRPSLFFGVFDGAEPIGGLNISHMNIDRDNAQVIRSSGNVMVLGVPDNGNLIETWATVYRHVVSELHPMVDGRDLDLTEYVCVTLQQNDPIAVGLIDELRGDLQVLGNARSPMISFRRRPSRPSRPARAR